MCHPPAAGTRAQLRPQVGHDEEDGALVREEQLVRGVELHLARVVPDTKLDVCVRELHCLHRNACRALGGVQQLELR